MSQNQKKWVWVWSSLLGVIKLYKMHFQDKSDSLLIPICCLKIPQSHGSVTATCSDGEPILPLARSGLPNQHDKQCISCTKSSRNSEE